ncbi:putative nicotinamide N-methyase [Halopolyspora algeriensis]|uniref:Putative nicotinamide N-methyase n=1 Tax=Halopolyspora algeriensis TaxID=1500506 RepID=A0A368VV18_9ACTN|nr:methyltransferase domain-containing protein [Halopolyspora algeriensis]RCW44508.1 putative nicotinamide N-methyase [Halopolyspora algeriensis]TQM55868.1 putative nicotinamide N-methyase [Halopolyspora algeriensis]
MSRTRDKAQQAQRARPDGETRPRTNPRYDVVTGEITVHGGKVRFAHPRQGTDLLYEDNNDDIQFPPYWAELWPSGIELAHAVSERTLDGLSVLELGCGLGLPSIAAALAGGHVLATDRSEDALAFTTANAHRNGVTVETAEGSWQQPEPLIARAPWQLVLAADVLYEQRNVSWLRTLLPELVDTSGEVWLADPKRPHADEFLAEAATDWHVSTADTRIPTVNIHCLRRRSSRSGTD